MFHYPIQDQFQKISLSNSPPDCGDCIEVILMLILKNHSLCCLTNKVLKDFSACPIISNYLNYNYFNLIELNRLMLHWTVAELKWFTHSLFIGLDNSQAPILHTFELMSQEHLAASKVMLNSCTWFLTWAYAYGWFVLQISQHN